MRALLLLLPLALAACGTPAMRPAAMPAPEEVIRNAAEEQEKKTPSNTATYHHERLNISITLPNAPHTAGNCPLSTPPPGGYRVSVFEDGNILTLAPDVYGIWMNKDPGDPSKGRDCVRINNSLATIQKSLQANGVYPFGWRMFVGENIRTGDDIATFVHQQFGLHCTASFEKKSEDDHLLIGFIHSSDDASSCPVDGLARALHSPEHNLLITMVRPQEDPFGEQGEEVLRGVMIGR